MAIMSSLTAPLSLPDTADHGPACPQGPDVPLTVTVYGPDTADGFVELASAWNDLVDASSSRPFFMRLDWQTVWWENLGLGEKWITAYHRADTGELVGILPLYLLSGADSHHDGQNQLSIIGCIEVSDYLDVIVTRGWEVPVYHAFLAWLDSDDAPPWDVVDLCNLPHNSSTYQILPDIARCRQMRVQVFQEDVAPAITLPATYESYLQDQVDKKQRHEIRRKQRRIERAADVGLYVVGPDHDLDREIQDFIRLQRASRPDKNEFMNAEMQVFFQRMGHRMFEAGLLSLLFLTLNGEKAATLFSFTHDRRYLLYNSGYDPVIYAHLSPGWAILAYAVQYAIVTGHRVFDFMQGDEAYKSRFGAVDYPVMRVILTR